MYTNLPSKRRKVVGKYHRSPFEQLPDTTPVTKVDKKKKKRLVTPVHQFSVENYGEVSLL